MSAPQRQQRHDGQILQQQDGDGPLAFRSGGRALLLEQLHDDGGGREHEPHGPDGGDRQGDPRRQRGQRQQHTTGDHLRGAQPEDLPPQRPQFGGAHLQPDDEQKQHHAQFRGVQQGFGIVDQPDAEGAHRQPTGQVAQHGTQAEPPEQGHGDGGRAQQNNGLYQAKSGRVHHDFPFSECSTALTREAVGPSTSILPAG